MPGKHSPEKLALRFQRARRRGYHRPRPARCLGGADIAASPCVRAIASKSVRCIIEKGNLGSSVEEGDCRVTMCGDSVASCCDRGVEDPLQVRDPWSLYAASKPRERARDAPAASCGVARPTTFDVSAEVYVPRLSFSSGGDSAWQQLAIAQQHTLACLTQQLCFCTQAKDCSAATIASGASVVVSTTDSSDNGVALAILQGQYAALSEKFAKLAGDLDRALKSLPGAVEASIDMRMPSFATHEAMQLLRTECAEIVTKSTESSLYVFSTQLDQLRETLTKDLFTQVEKLMTNFDGMIDNRLSNLEKGMCNSREFVGDLDACTPSPPCAERRAVQSCRVDVRTALSSSVHDPSPRSDHVERILHDACG